MPEPVALGQITCPSGELVVIDAGYLGLWSGAGSPADVRSDFDLPPGTDLEIVGPDAESVARSFDRQGGVTCYDIPDHGLTDFIALFEEHCREKGFDARLEPIARVPHRERVGRAARRGGEEFIVFGVPAVAVKVPDSGPHTVVGIPADPDSESIGEWHSFRVRFRDTPVADQRLLGQVGVDWARVLFADADALSAWQHDEPLDGLADVAFWGRAADEAAREHGVGLLGRPGEETAYGWRDLPLDEANQRALTLLKWKESDPDRMMMVDVRPHSDHFWLMHEVRANPMASGTVTVGGAWMVGAMTGCGDGLFPLYLELDSDGEPVALRLLLA